MDTQGLKRIVDENSGAIIFVPTEEENKIIALEKEIKGLKVELINIKKLINSILEKDR